MGVSGSRRRARRRLSRSCNGAPDRGPDSRSPGFRPFRARRPANNERVRERNPPSPAQGRGATPRGCPRAPLYLARALNAIPHCFSSGRKLPGFTPTAAYCLRVPVATPSVVVIGPGTRACIQYDRGVRVGARIRGAMCGFKSRGLSLDRYRVCLVLTPRKKCTDNRNRRPITVAFVIGPTPVASPAQNSGSLVLFCLVADQSASFSLTAVAKHAGTTCRRVIVIGGLLFSINC